MTPEILPDLKDKGSRSQDLPGTWHNEWKEPCTKTQSLSFRNRDKQPSGGRDPTAQ